MLSVSGLISEVEVSLGRTGGDRGRTLGRITGLFVAGAPNFGPEQVALFDAVIQRIATGTETRARAELSERLAGLANAPPNVISSLADDEIGVARPVLIASPRLDDQTLMRIAVTRGREHMLAIGGRRELTPAVTDVLVERGDGAVRQVVAGNLGARFSPVGTATLVEHARADEVLCGLLGRRPDLPSAQAQEVIRIRRTAAERDGRAGPPGFGGAMPAAVGAECSVAAQHLVPGREIDEEDLASFAEEGDVAETISALVSLTGLSAGCLQRVFRERDNDLLIVVGKAQGWSWLTVRLLLRLRDPSLTDRHHFRRAIETFEALSTATALRVVHFLKMRETAGQIVRAPRVESLRSG